MQWDNVKPKSSMQRLTLQQNLFVGLFYEGGGFHCQWDLLLLALRRDLNTLTSMAILQLAERAKSARHHPCHHPCCTVGIKVIVEMSQDRKRNCVRGFWWHSRYQALFHAGAPRREQQSHCAGLSCQDTWHIWLQIYSTESKNCGRGQDGLSHLLLCFLIQVCKNGFWLLVSTIRKEVDGKFQGVLEHTPWGQTSKLCSPIVSSLERLPGLGNVKHMVR